jgi:hypothetical protein
MMPRDLRLDLGAQLLCVALLSSACGSPPTREMDQAQGAIDAARAAGADRYATDEYQAAVAALKQSNDAVALRDYRLALNYALDSRERAQIAARNAADQRATLRGGAERRLAEITAMLDQANQRLRAAEAARVPPRSLSKPRGAISTAEASLQKAGTEISEGDYLASQTRLSDSATQLRTAIAELDEAVAGRGSRNRR